jgi:large subunit ribosomal protein L10
VDRAAKEALKTSLHDVFKDTGVVVVAHYTGMTVAQMTDYRRKVKAAGGSVKVAKNRIAKLALKDTDAVGISDLLKGPTVLAYSKDPITAAKMAVEYAKTNDKLVILGGVMGTTILNPANVKALADLPSLDQLRSTLLSLFNTPATQLARTIKEPGAALARVIKAKAKTKRKPRVGCPFETLEMGRLILLTVQTGKK